MPKGHAFHCIFKGEVHAFRCVFRSVGRFSLQHILKNQLEFCMTHQIKRESFTSTFYLPVTVDKNRKEPHITFLRHVDAAKNVLIIFYLYFLLSTPQ